MCGRTKSVRHRADARKYSRSAFGSLHHRFQTDLNSSSSSMVRRTRVLLSVSYDPQPLNSVSDKSWFEIIEALGLRGFPEFFAKQRREGTVGGTTHYSPELGGFTL